MKKRRLIFVLLCLLMTSTAALPVTAAGTETTANTTAAAETRIEKAKTAFRQLLDKCASNFDTSTWRFDFAFIDSDDIPELLVSLTADSKNYDDLAVEVQVYRYDDKTGQALFTDTFGTYGSMTYLPYQNKIWDYDPWGDVRVNDPVYSKYIRISGLYQMDGTPYIQVGTNVRGDEPGFVYNGLGNEYFTVTNEERQEMYDYVNGARSFIFTAFDVKDPKKCYIYTHENFDTAFEKAYEKSLTIREYCNAYASYLYGLMYDHPELDLYFTTAYIDDDIIPELIVTNCFNQADGYLNQGEIIISTVRNKETTEIAQMSGYFPEISYIEEQNRFHIRYANYVNSLAIDWSDYYASINNGELAIEKSFVQKRMQENDPLSTRVYLMDGKRVSVDTFTAEQNKIQDKLLLESEYYVDFFRFEMTKENIMSVFDYYR